MRLPPTRRASCRGAAARWPALGRNAGAVAASARLTAAAGSPQAMNSGTMKPSRPPPNCTSCPCVGDLAAGRGDERVARRDVPFAGRGEAGIDVGFAFRHPAEFDRRAEHLPDRAGPAVDEGFGPGIAMRAADRRDPGLAAFRQRRVRIGSAHGAVPSPTQPLGAAADDAAPDQSKRRRADDAEQRRPFVTSARLTVNSLRPATNSLVPSSGSTRKKLPPKAASPGGRALPTAPAYPEQAAPGLRQ